jgi:hypothetical protein
MWALDLKFHWRQSLGLVLLVLVGQLAAAVTFEGLLSPGTLSAAHAKYEDDCSNCHDRANSSRQSELCMNCHKDIAVDVQKRSGFHGRMANAGTAGQCLACHSEHHGRSSSIVRLDTVQFDHGQTNFALTGAHRGVDCAGCHKARGKWRDVNGNCLACHKNDDYHGGQLGERCADCHTTGTWAGARFDHGKTAFALTGAHQSVSCGACHLGGRYQSAPKSCFGCHATDDVHRGDRGQDCGSCHITADWKSARFDHEKETGYALLGVHARENCLSCHRSGRYDDKLPRTCVGCHRADDSHAARFGDKCQDCHSNDKWQPVNYDHAAKAGFLLSGNHAHLDCHTCHTANLATQTLGTECLSCHRAIDPHGGLLVGGCDSCHAQEAWRRDVSFDHDLSDFPLLGLHNIVSCAQCHRTLGFRSAATTCNGCHATQDVHKGGLGEKCDSCHSPNGWGIWDFDHGKQTNFPLTGAHKPLTCASCHKQSPGTTKTSSECVACHRSDDRHLGQFGLQCQRCHTTTSFKGARIQ